MNILEQFRNEKLKTTKDLSTYNVSMHSLLTSKWKMDFDVFLPTKNYNLQRPLVWADFQKKELILSIILKRQIGKPIMIRHEFEDKKIVYQVLDGKQRLNTIREFLEGKFSIEIFGKEYFYNDLFYQYCGFRINDFENELKNMNVTFYNSYFDDCITDEQKIEIFVNVNFKGTPQEIEHLQKLQG